MEVMDQIEDWSYIVINSNDNHVSNIFTFSNYMFSCIVYYIELVNVEVLHNLL